MLHYLSFLQYGFGLTGAALTLNRLALGLFFSISGYHKLFNAKRHAQLTATLRACGIPFISFCQWFVPCVEFLGGLALLSGILAPFAAMGLIVICAVAIATDGFGRIPAWKPIDAADWLDDCLYLPESLYVVGLLIVLAAGAGSLTLI